MPTDYASMNAGFAAGLRLCKDTNAGCIKMIPRDKNDDPVALMIIVRGKKESIDILAAVEKAEATWDEV